MTTWSQRTPCTGKHMSDTSRVKTDAGQTSFFEGREFRSFLELAIPGNGSAVVRFTCPVNFILFGQHIQIDASGVRMEALLAPTVGGSFSTPMPVIGKNRMPDRPQPYYVAQATVDTGGTATGGTVVEAVRVVSAGAGANTSTVGDEVGSERGLPAGTYYIKFTNLTGVVATGTYDIWWEERP